jgi:uncharacterized membrane protein YozB (DUF420 family)
VNALVAVQGMALFLLLGWKAWHLTRAPRDLPLRCVVACLACAVAGYIAGLPGGSTTAPVSRWLVLTDFSLVVATACCLDCFFIFSLLAAPAARRHALRRALWLAAAVGTMTAAVAVTPPGAGIRDQSVPAVAVFYLAFLVVNGGFLADAWHLAQRGAQDAAGALARGLRLASAGFALLTAALIPLTAVVIMRWAHLAQAPGLVTAGQLIAVPGVLVFLAGVGYPGAVMRISAARVRARHRRLYRQLAPLWDELHRAFPQDALARVPSSPWKEALSPWSVHRRYYRRVIECRDGLVRISPHLAADDTARPLAERLLSALRTTPTAPNPPSEAVPIAIPVSTGLDADAAELAALAAQVAAARHNQDQPTTGGTS